MRDMFSYKPLITKEQFFNAGFAERKIIMCAEVIQMIREKNRSLQPSKKPTTSAVSTISQNLHKKVATIRNLGTGRVRIKVMVFNATFNNISVISRQSVFLME